MKSKHADLLNNLDAMQCSVAYAARRSVLQEAESVIVQQENALAEKDKKMAKLQAWYGKMFGTPCEEIRHAQMMEEAENKLAVKDHEIARFQRLTDSLPQDWIAKNKEFNDLMRMAVDFAEYLLQGHQHRLKVLRFAKLKAGIVEADKFLTSPAVREWKEHHDR